MIILKLQKTESKLNVKMMIEYYKTPGVLHTRCACYRISPILLSNALNILDWLETKYVETIPNNMLFNFNSLFMYKCILPSSLIQ